MKRYRTVIIIALIGIIPMICAVFALQLIMPSDEAEQTQAAVPAQEVAPAPVEEPPLRMVYAAARELPVGTLLGEEDLTPLGLEEQALPRGHIAVDELTAIARLRGHVVREAIADGVPLTWQALVGPHQRGFLAAVLRPGMRAVTIRLGAGRRTTVGLADVLERAWNTQGFKTRAALSGIRLRAGRNSRGLRRSYYAPLSGYRLHAYDPGEIRWLRALADQAASTVEADKPDEHVPNVVAKTTPAKRAAPADDKAGTDIYALEARIRAANEEAGTLQLGSPPEELTVNDELAALLDAAKRLPSAVRRRMRESYGIGFTQALSRLRNSDDGKTVTSEIKAALIDRRVPRWLHDLASTLLTDAGAQSRYGARTASIRLHWEEQADAAYRAVESETGAVGQLTPLGLVEQVRLGFAFATDAWRGHTALRSAGKESGWILDKGEAEGSDFSADEREVLEAARRIELALDRIQRAHGKQATSALEEAFMAAEAFRGVGPATCIAAGWPDTAEIPDPRNPEEVARIATVAEALHEDIRAIANKFIASWVAVTKDYGTGESDRASPQREAAAPPNDSEAGKRRHTGPAWKARGPAADREWGQP